MEGSTFDFSQPILSQEEIDEMLRQSRIDWNEDVDAEAAYYNNNRSTVSRNIKNGVIDPKILTKSIMIAFINDGFSEEYYDEYVQQYCLTKGIDYEEYLAKREAIITEISGATPQVQVAPSLVDEEYKFEGFDFSQPILSQEEIDEMLRQSRIDWNEDVDAEAAYYNNNRSTVSRNIKNGVIDPKILTKYIMIDFINDGFSEEYYDEYVQQYCKAKGLDYDKYKEDRQKKIDEIAATTPPPQPTLTKKQPVQDIGYDELDDDDDYDYEDYGDNYEETVPESKTPLSREEITNFGDAAVEKKDSNLPLKQNWFSKMKLWTKKMADKLFNKSDIDR